eukprot:CAMPEP_0178462980 /NCGR_PEP_ID=MMETSP0689_2-20121128/50097_1 /TAXON_ID=160604 /ORGANISM="Amphidinium massartii, Strain CS-259" /LENGTH=107 /DNA_ID=CAMNT_0020089849 /DNA_START=582 /DNA_END=902 /DNA_ORIENTATION=-
MDMLSEAASAASVLKEATWSSTLQEVQYSYSPLEVMFEVVWICAMSANPFFLRSSTHFFGSRYQMKRIVSTASKPSALILANKASHLAGSSTSSTPHKHLTIRNLTA